MSWLLQLDELLVATGGKELSDPQLEMSGVGTDSRANLKGQLFVALKGENFDGHDFVDKAIAQGASTVLVHEWRSQWKPHLSKVSFVQVEDTLLGLQALGRYWRRKHKYIVVGISGSNGKTTSKEYSAAIVKKYIPTYASKGSFNNHWGVPMSILQAQPKDRVLILEMGMNHLGELTVLTDIAEPDVVVVTMVGRSHIGELGSQQKVAQAKEEMYLSCPDAIQIFNIDNEWTFRMYDAAKTLGKAKRIITFSEEDPRTDVKFSVERMTPNGLEVRGRIGNNQRSLTIGVFGRHNVINLMVAACVGLSLGLTPEQIWQSLSELQDTAWGRNQLVDLASGPQVLFDAYNANPDSMAVMLANFSEMKTSGRKFLVLGDMLELGAISEDAHRDLGEAVGQLGVAGVLYQGRFSGDFARGLKSRAPLLSSVEFDEALAKKFAASFQPHDLIAIKGSRGMKLERILKAWNPLAFAEKS